MEEYSIRQVKLLLIQIKSILLIEGNLNNELEYIKNKNSIYGALLSLILSYNFKIIYSSDIEETANILEIIHKHRKYEK